MEKENRYYGNDCPVGMVQVEFVGCSPADRRGEYGWKPCNKTFLEISVDGERFRLDVGDLKEHGVNGRGIAIIGPCNMAHRATAINACCISIPKKDAPQSTKEAVENIA